MMRQVSEDNVSFDEADQSEEKVKDPTLMISPGGMNETALIDTGTQAAAMADMKPAKL